MTAVEIRKETKAEGSIHLQPFSLFARGLSLAQISMAKRFSGSGRWPLVTISEANSAVMSASGIP